MHTDGDIVADGTDFRNSAHLRYKADILVPCGGRPESINVNNVSQLWDADGVPNFKYIVCGAFPPPERAPAASHGLTYCRCRRPPRPPHHLLPSL